MAQLGVRFIENVLHLGVAGDGLAGQQQRDAAEMVDAEIVAQAAHRYP